MHEPPTHAACTHHDVPTAECGLDVPFELEALQRKKKGRGKNANEQFCRGVALPPLAPGTAHAPTLLPTGVFFFGRNVFAFLHRELWVASAAQGPMLQLLHAMGPASKIALACPS